VNWSEKLEKKPTRSATTKRVAGKKISASASAPRPETIVDFGRREPPDMDNSSGLNWDVIGISTTAVTLAGAAIFFVSGWFYEARWYGFYGLNISQLQLSPIDFMVQGIPGILLFLISFCISWVVIKVSKGIFQTFWSYRIKGNSAGVQLINIILRSELVWVGLLSYLLLAVLDLSAEIILTVLFRRAYQTSYIILAGIFASLLLVLSMALGLGSLRSNNSVALASLSLTQWYLDDLMPNFQAAIKGILSVLTTFVIALTFILSISVSGILGQFDAISHRRSLSGWFVPQMIVTSEKSIPILEAHRMESEATDEGNAFTYGTFGLVASDDEKYYMVEYPVSRYQVHPKVYTVNKQAVDISFVIRNVASLFDANTAEKPTATPVPTSTPPPTQTETPIP
jgi:hypothetical protein